MNENNKTDKIERNEQVLYKADVKKTDFFINIYILPLVIILLFYLYSIDNNKQSLNDIFWFVPISYLITLLQSRLNIFSYFFHKNDYMTITNRGIHYKYGRQNVFTSRNEIMDFHIHTNSSILYAIRYRGNKKLVMHDRNGDRMELDFAFLEIDEDCIYKIFANKWHVQHKKE